MSTEDLVRQVQLLPAAEQAAVVEALLNALDRTDPALDAAWAAEAEERVAAYRRGELRAVPLTEVLGKYRNR